MPLPPLKKPINTPEFLSAKDAKDAKDLVYPAKDRFQPNLQSADANLYHVVLFIESELKSAKRALLHHAKDDAKKHILRIHNQIEKHKLTHE